jgi:hypothetical protein
MVVGPDVNISRWPDNQAETTIAINPKTPQNLFAASVDFNGGTAGPGLFADYSTGSGALGTWDNRMNLGQGSNNDDSLPAAGADPSAAFDQFGNLFLTYTTPQTGVLQTGTSSGANGAAADKKLNDTSRAWAPGEWTGCILKITAGTGNGQSQRITTNTNTQITVQNNWATVPDATSQYTITSHIPIQAVAVAYSTDSGATFTWMAYLGTSGIDVDQPRIATGPGGKVAKGSVWVTWRDNDGFLYAAGAPVTGNGQFGKFIAPQKLQGTKDKAYGRIQVGPKGQVVVTYQDDLADQAPPKVGNIYAATDTSGLGAGPGFDAAITAVPDVHVNSPAIHVGFRSDLPAAHRRQPDAEANLAWDRSGNFGVNADKGRLYLVYMDSSNFIVNGGMNPNVDTDIYEVDSDDNGKTWTFPQKIQRPDTNSQFLPAIAVDQTTGYVAAAWYDARNDPGNTKAQIYGTISTDGGQTWLRDKLIGQAVSDASKANSFEYGDYIGLDFNNGSFYPIWADNSNSTGDNNRGGSMDVYTAKVDVKDLKVPMMGMNSNVNPSRVGQAITFTATVSGSGSTPTGTVTFLVDGTPIGSATLDSSGTATLTTAGLSAGSHYVLATYSGDANYSSIDSDQITQVVNPGSTSTSTAVASSLNPSTYGQGITLTATVTSGSGTPTGTITFKGDAVTIGTGTLDGTGTATLTSSSLNGGTHSITAAYGGDATFAASTSASLSLTVNLASTSTALASSLNPSPFGQLITFTAMVTSGVDTPTGTVSFLDGTTVLGTSSLDKSGTALFTTSSLSQSSHSITAVYAGDVNYAGSTSGILTEVVTAALPSTTTTMTSSVNPSVAGQSVNLTAQVQPNSGSGVPTGTVTFMDSSGNLGMVTLSAGNATLTVSTFIVATHSLTAVYSGDSNYAGSSSAVLTQTVNLASTTTSVVSNHNPALDGQAITFTATVTSTFSNTPTGTVSFDDGTNVIGTGTLSLVNGSYQATFTSTLAVGSHSITAVYSGDETDASSTSSTLAQSVLLDPTMTVETSSQNPDPFGTPVTFTATVTAPNNPGNLTPTGTVQFWEVDPNTGANIALLSTATLDANGHAIFTTSSLSRGTHRIKALYLGDSNFTSSFATFDEMIV